MLKRLLGAGLGWSFGGPIGAILGWWIAGKIGNSQNHNHNNYQQQFNQHTNHTTTSDFVVSFLILASCVIKADGRIVKAEIEFVKQFLLKHFDREMVQEMMMFLKDIENKEYSVDSVCEQINSRMTEEEKIQILHFLYGVSLADGEFNSKEEAVIDQIARHFRMHGSVYDSIKNQYKYGFKGSQGAGVRGSDLQQAYRILDVKESASDEEIKKSYRELSMKHHPDKVAHLGEEVKKSAEEKFKIISNAYQQLRKVRGF